MALSQTQLDLDTGDASPSSPEAIPSVGLQPHAWSPSPGRFEALLHVSSETLLAVDAKGQVLTFQPSGEAASVYPPESVVGRNIADILPPRLAKEGIDLVGRALASGGQHIELFEVPIDSVVREFEARAAAASEREAVVCIRDLTDRRRLEREILEISHREQQRIGQDLHDSLGQHLTGITFLSKALQNRLRERGLAEAAQAEEIAQLVVQTLGHTRNIARGLFPLELESSGWLRPALSELVANAEKLFRVVCRLEMDAASDFADPQVSTELFRITQEAISNAVRHGKARRLAVRYEQQGGQGTLWILDDGTGLPPDRKELGLGLRIMSFRANRIGGRIEVSTRPEGGTQVRCDFPLPASVGIRSQGA